MYTAVLMMALTTGVDMPDAHRGGRGGGCCGCYGGGYGGCYGGGYGGGYGGCCGCYGGGYGMGYGGGFGGCSGMGYGGGYGGCYGGGYGGVISGGCSGVISGGYGMSGAIIMPGTGTGTGTGGEKIKNPPKQKDGKETMAPAPATIVVELPADAKLTIDNEATTSIGTSRVFTSPNLNPGKEYHYTLKAEVVRDGKPVKAEKVVAIKAGEITPVTLTLPAAGVAQR